MSDPVFVGRETELRKLNTFLQTASQGKMQVVFLAGEAGAGKSSMVAEFVRRGEAADPKLISSLGECNAQTGIADPYLPFRQVLTALTAGNEDAASSEKEKNKKMSRWKDFVQVSTKTLMMVGPDLVGIFVPGGTLLTRIGTQIAINSNLAGKLSERVGKKPGAEPPKLDSALDQEKIFEQYAAVLKTLAKDRTLVLILDDLQWADNGSINLLFHLARQLKDSRLLLVGTYRPDDVSLGRDGGRHPLEAILNELKRYYGDIVIDLSQTEKSEGRKFVDSLVDSEANVLDRDFRDELFAHTGGHPLFTVELLRNLQECGTLVKDDQGRWTQANKLDWADLPARIEGVIGERIARLPADLHETLTIASVIGEVFAAQVVGQVQKVDEGEVVRNLSRELDKRYLLVIEGSEIKVGGQYLSQYRFEHVLIQQYLYNELGAGERRILHGKIASELETLYGDQVDGIALQLAHHFEASGNFGKAITYLVCAADNAYRVYAHDEAVAAYTRVLKLDDQAALDGGQLTHIYLQRGRALELSNRYQLALQNYDDMLAAARKRQDRAMELSASMSAGTLYSTITPVADASRGLALSQESLKLAAELGDRAAEARVLWNLQLVNLYQNKTAEAIEYGEKSLSIARELDLHEQMAYVLGDLGWAYTVACQFDKAQESLDIGTRIWRELGNKPMQTNNINLFMFSAWWSGRDAEVLKNAEEGLQISTAIKEVWNQASARNFQGLVWLEQGEIGKGLEALEDSIRLAGQGNPVYEIWYRAMLCRTYADLGSVDLAMDQYRTHHLPNKDVPPAPMRTATLILYAMVELASHELDKAAATLADCIPSAPPWEAMLMIARCRLALARGDYSNAVALADAAVDFTGKYQLGRYMPEALFLKGKAHLLRGELGDAKSALEQARTEAEKLGSRRLMWQIIAMLARLEPDQERSAKLLAEAGAIVQYIADRITQPELRASFLASTYDTAVSVAAGYHAVGK